MKRIIIQKTNKEWNFEGFKIHKRKCRYGNVITIYERGLFTLNPDFLREVATDIKGCNYVKLFYDKASCSIGLKFTNNISEIGICKITPNSYPTRSFASRSFFTHYSLNLKNVTGKYKPIRGYINEKIGYLYIISLKNKVGEK